MFVLALVCVLVSVALSAPSVPWTALEPASRIFANGTTRDIQNGLATSTDTAEWEEFKQKFNKQYDDETEEERRRAIFLDNLSKIVNHNKLYANGHSPFAMGVNPYTDMENKEFVSVMNGYRNASVRHASAYMSPNVALDLPKSLDWRTKGYVTPVKNQLDCGSCWAFASTGTLEGQHFRSTGNLVSLSEQNLMDCSGRYGNLGCNGGNQNFAFMYIRDNGGIDTESSYPYKARQGPCRFKPADVGATLTSVVTLPQGSETKLQEATATIGPIAISIDAGHLSFQHYTQGVYVEPACSRTHLDHAVLVVGYGSTGGRDYWIVKNSWGKQWGMNGYIWMARNRNNQCGVATFASYPVV